MPITQKELKQLLAAPALEAPNGVTPEFENPPNGNILAYRITTFCMVLTTLCVIIRLYGRWLLEPRELTTIPSPAFMICAYGAFCGAIFAAYAFINSPGSYVHTWNLRRSDLVEPFRLILVYRCCYSAALPCIKSAILVDWCQVFATQRDRKNVFWVVSIALIVLQCAWGVIYIVLLNLQCNPHHGIWEFWVCEERYKLSDIMLASPIIQLVTDVIIAMLPQTKIWGLQMSWQRRTIVAIFFGVSAIACIAASFVLYYTVTFTKEEDTMWNIGPLRSWSDLEMTCGFFILSATRIRKMVAKSRLFVTVKNFLDMTIKSRDPPNETFGPQFVFNPHDKLNQTSDNSSQLHKHGVSMDNLTSGSQEQLRPGEQV
ncbi:hypothetical protein QSH57_004901 [Fusarium oxysporum f. sp. vasinfectum]|nr:hypothetical protein QSH57_004901 [Fusarium oxysporum f. sp. vasinfectum]